MRSNTIFDTRRFYLMSYGNGTAYALHHRALDQSILFQGDDAEQFRTEMDALAARLDYDNALGVLWNDYNAAP